MGTPSDLKQKCTTVVLIFTEQNSRTKPGNGNICMFSGPHTHTHIDIYLHLVSPLMVLLGFVWGMGGGGGGGTLN